MSAISLNSFLARGKKAVVSNAIFMILTLKLGMLSAWLLLTWYDSLENYIFKYSSTSLISVFYYTMYVMICFMKFRT